MPLDREDPAYKGQRDFTPLALRFYDPFVLQFSASWVWHCPLERLLEHYRWHIRPNHLDVGPGTGYFLEHAGLPEGSEVTILDQHGNPFPLNPAKPNVALCRCGHSSRRPFCDGTHNTCGFQSVEIAPTPAP